MSYSEQDLEVPILTRISKGQLDAIGLPRALEEALLLLFLRPLASDLLKATEIIKEPLDHLCDVGALQYKKF